MNTKENAALSSVQVSTRMLQHWEGINTDPDMDASGGFAIQHTDKTSELMILAGPGGGSLYTVRADTTNETGWLMEDTHQDFELADTSFSNQRGIQGYRFVGVANDTATWLFAIAHTNDDSIDIRYTHREHGKPWPKHWQKIAGNSELTNIEEAELQARIVEGVPILAAWVFITKHDKVPGKGSLWHVEFDEPGQPWNELRFGWDVGACLWVHTLQGDGILARVYPAGMDPQLQVFMYPFSENRLYSMNVECGSSVDFLFASASLPGENSMVYWNQSADQKQHALFRLDFSEINPLPQFLANPEQVEFQIYPTHAADGTAQLFFPDSKGRVFVIHEPVDKTGQWSEPIDMGFVSDSLLIAQMTADESDLFYWQQNRLMRMWENPPVDSTSTTTTHEDPDFWQHERIPLPGGTLAGRAYYATKLTLLDNDGYPLAGQCVSLTAGEDVRTVINDRYTLISDDLPITLKANGAGSITLYSPTNTINAAELFISDGAKVLMPVRRNQIEIDKMSNITVDQINKILPAKQKKNAAAVQLAVSQAIAYAQSASPAVAGQRTLIDVQAHKDTCWSYEYIHGVATFTNLNAAEAKQKLDKARGLPVLDIGKHKSFWSWVGDLMQDVEHDVETSFELVVQTLETGIELTITAVVDGVKYVYSRLHKFIDEAVAFAEDILAALAGYLKVIGLVIFNALEFKADIWRAKQSIEKSISHNLPKVRKRISLLGTTLQTDPLFDPANFSSTLNAAKPWLADTKLSPRTGQFGSNEVSTDLQTFMNEHAVIFENILHYGGDRSLHGSAKGDWSKKPAVEEIVKSITSLLGATKKLKADANLMKLFKDMVSSLGDSVSSNKNFRNMELTKLLDVVEPLGKPVLKKMPSVMPHMLSMVDSSFAVLIEDGLLTTRMKVSNELKMLYNLFNTGKEEHVTPVGLAGLMAALPITIFFQLRYGKPWIAPEDEARIAKADDPVALVMHSLLGDKESSCVGLGVTAIVLQFIWGSVDSLANFVGIFKEVPIIYLIGPVAAIPFIEYMLLGVLLGVESSGDDAPAKSLITLYGWELALSMLIPLLIIGIFIALLAITIAVIYGAQIELLMGYIVAGSIGSILIFFIGIPQIIVASKIVKKEHDKGVDAKWKTRSHYFPAAGSLCQFVGMVMPEFGALVTAVADFGLAEAMIEGVTHCDDSV